jgi:hypothetical protein
MLEAFGWGLLAQSSLLVAGLLVCWVTVPTKVIGILGGFGAGAMIAAVSFDLFPEAQTDIQPWQTGLWMLVGVAVFLLADQLVERRFGSQGRAARWASSWVPSSTASLNRRSLVSRSASAPRSVSALWPRCSSRISLKPRGGPCGRRPARDAHQLTDSLLVRAWRSTCRRGDRRGVLRVGHAQHSGECKIHGKDGVADQISRVTSGITRGDR